MLRRFLTTVGEGGFRGQKSPDRLPEFRAEFEELLGGLETSLGKHGGPFLLGCGSCAVAKHPAARQGLEIIACQYRAHVYDVRTCQAVLSLLPEASAYLRIFLMHVAIRRNKQLTGECLGCRKEVSYVDTIYVPALERFAANMSFVRGFHLRGNPAYPNLSAWFDAINALPSYQQVPHAFPLQQSLVVSD